MGQRELKFQQAWGISDGKDLLPFTIRHTREEVIRDFCCNHGYDIPEGTKDVWRWLKGRGNRCALVTMSFYPRGKHDHQ